MKTLLIENSSSTGSLAVANEAHEIVEHRQFQRAGDLAIQVDELYRRYQRFDELVVGIGPGSYTGLRVAVSFAIGLKISTGCEAYGCPSLYGFPEASYVVIGDARRGTFFYAALQDGKAVAAPELIATEQLSEKLKRWENVPIYSVTPFPDELQAELRQPMAEHLIHRRAHFEPLGEPIYLKPPHITS
jgi:tRNA threonylcarbamoyladenosine biosynthesis protein TsaB